MFAGQATRLRPRLTRYPFLRAEKPGHLGPHRHKRDAVLVGKVHGRFYLIIREDQIRLGLLNNAFEISIRCGPERVTELLDLYDFSLPFAGLVVPFLESEVEFFILRLGDCATNDMNDRDKWIRFYQLLSAFQGCEFNSVSSCSKNGTYL